MFTPILIGQQFLYKYFFLSPKNRSAEFRQKPFFSSMFLWRWYIVLRTTDAHEATLFDRENIFRKVIKMVCVRFFFVWIISWYAYLKVLVGDAARIYQRPLFSHQIYSIEYIFDGIFLVIFKLYLRCSHKTVVFTTFKNKIFKFFLSKNVRRPGHDCKAKFHVWCVTDYSVALSNILEHFGRNSPQNRLHWIFMRHAKKPLTKNSFTWKPQKKEETGHMFIALICSQK